MIMTTMLMTICISFKSHAEEIPESYIEYVEDGIIVHGPAFPALYLTTQEMAEMKGVATNEAGNQGVKGMALVMRVVLNRLARGGYGNDIHSVIYAPSQFATTNMPLHHWSKECEIALQWVLWGWDESEDALYFCSAGGYNGPIPLFKYKDHWFATK